MVARRDSAHRRTNRLDNASALVPEYCWEWHARKIPITSMQIGVTHAGRHDPNKHLVSPRV
jgi:hypothetical protein